MRNFKKSSGVAILVFALSGTVAQAGPNGHCPRSKFATCGVTQAPAITTQPASQTITAGQPVAFSVAASGTGPLTYQWKRNGAAISGANQASYSTSTSTSDNGAQFSATVSNSAGAATSNAAVLTVDPSVVAPSITAQPSSVNVTAGQSASFSIAASGTGPLAYQWNRNGAAINGANSSSYTISATVVGDNSAQFSAMVSNSAGSIASAPATLSVTAAVVAPSITSQPLSQTVTQGQAATFSVASTGTAPMTYQWSRNGAAIAGANSSTYTTPVTTSSDNGSQFAVSVSNSAGSLTSGAAALTVQAPALPSGCALSSGTWANSSLPQAQMDTFRISFDATPSVSPMDGVTGLSFGPAAAYTDLATAVRFNSTGTIDAVNGTTFSAASAIPFTAGVAYHFILDVYISTHTYNAYVVINSTQTVIGSNLAFRSTQATAAALSNLGSMAAAGTDTICNIALSAAPATAPAITTQPLSQSVTAGQTATFSVTATGTATLNYQWLKNGAPISAATSSSYTTPATTLSDNNTQFSVAVSNAAGSV
ncbi:MAG TPA: immunoglobulin domain-containing protein, partial [Candidatus Acidoferrum sp.]